MKIAKFTKRISAYILDMILPSLCGIALPIILSALENIKIAWYFLGLIGIATEFVLYVLITTFSLVFSNGFTLGNRIMHIRTVHKDGSKITFSDALVKAMCLGFWVYPIINAIFMLNIHTEETGPDVMTHTINVEQII